MNLLVLAVLAASQPRHVVVTDTTCEILEPLQFDANDARVAPRHQKLLHTVAQTLLGNPGITLVEVEGTADAAEATPELLGLVRATTVVVALIAEGVPAYRLRTGTIGATRPLSTTEPIRNRRIEFLIVKRDPSL